MVKKIVNKYILLFLIISSCISGQETQNANSSHYVWKSLILPGWGEYSLNQNKRAKFFVLTEALLWVGFGGSILSSRLEKNTYQSFAREHAGVGLGDKPRQFWVDIGNYNNRDEFIEEHLRWRDFEAIEAYGDEIWDWHWDSNSNQLYFEEKRVKSDKLQLAAKFFIGGIILNHIVSGIDALYLSRKLSGKNLSLMVLPKINNSKEVMTYQISLSF